MDRLALFFASARTRQGILARRLLDRPAPDDASLIRRLQDQLLDEFRSDARFEGAVVPAIWRAH
jgi:hypothetical protein